MLAEWGWDLLRSFLGAGAGTAAVTGALALWRERGKKRDEASYLAMRLAVVFEKFASDCSRLIYDNKNAYHHPDQEFPHWDINLPALAEYPPEADGWKSLAPEPASDCLSLRNRISEIQFRIGDYAEYRPEDLEKDVRRGAWDLGLEAWSLAVQLREAFGLKNVRSAFGHIGRLNRAKAQTLSEDAAKAQSENELYASANRSGS
ncbi:hypothetical protein FHR71_002166 [Methylobacterium sp. RAS18]|nr:hypothetical protein [Methylobacterium sp. RAS18]